VSRLVETFLSEGCNVQLRHVPTETSWEDVVQHGYIATFDAAGKQLVRRDGFQHNRKLRNGGAYDMSAIKAVVDETLEALPKKLPTFIESNYTSKVEYEAWMNEQTAGVKEQAAGAPGAAAA